jgi:hypothetical protein
MAIETVRPKTTCKRVVPVGRCEYVETFIIVVNLGLCDLDVGTSKIIATEEQSLSKGILHKIAAHGNSYLQVDFYLNNVAHRILGKY